MAAHEEKKLSQWFDSLPAHLQEDETMKFVQWALMQPDVSLQQKRNILASIPQACTVPVPPEFTEAWSKVEKEVTAMHEQL
jgi:hypothetical protein